ncbi:MAG: hypothetical protein ABW321_26660 [Polyangiales bacterium]
MAEENSQFLKFSPAPDGLCKYKDFMKHFVVLETSADVTAQGEGSVPKIEPFQFYIRGGNTHVQTLQQLARGNQKTKLAKATFTRCVYINDARKPVLVMDLEGITLKNVKSAQMPGDALPCISFLLEATKIKWKSTDYDTKGSILTSVGPTTWDFEAGEFT